MLMIMYVLMMITLLVMIMLTLNFIISKKKYMDREKSSPFECGFDPLSSTRSPFSLRFYLISLIFLIFDIEIIILLPMMPSLWYSNPLNWLITSMLFSLMLITGVYIEWKEGSLYWMK
uniref:NADH-ubiquinone oxidoreductase chain 3 n=1 Tax=Janus sp. TaxID=3003420 RepID=A0A9E8YXH4_9HYME|nr:NADH dehydrogenase subunit 3 [Janus sp.]